MNDKDMQVFIDALKTDLNQDISDVEVYIDRYDKKRYFIGINKEGRSVKMTMNVKIIQISPIVKLNEE